MLDLLLPAFTDELVKLAFKMTPRGKAEVKAEKHFESADPDWKSFEKNLRSKHFRDVVETSSRADDKLKRYTKNYGGYLASTDKLGKVESESSNKKYTIKLVGDRIACGCKDWQYKRSHGGGDCKHIAKLKEKRSSLGEMAKLALLGDVMRATGPVAWNRMRAGNQVNLARASKMKAKQDEFEERESALRKRYGT